MVHDCIELIAQDTIDLSNSLIDHCDYTFIRCSFHTLIQNLRGKLPQHFFRVFPLGWLDRHLAFQNNFV